MPQFHELENDLRRLGKNLPNPELIAESVLSSIDRLAITPVRYAPWKRNVRVFVGIAALLVIAAGWLALKQFQHSGIPIVATPQEAAEPRLVNMFVNEPESDSQSLRESPSLREPAAYATTLGFSSIWNVNGWSVDRLAEAGIKVSRWAHDRQREDPPLNWVKVTFDCSSLPQEEDVLMTVSVTSQSNNSIAAARAERSKNDNQSVALLFNVGADYGSLSCVEIFIWKNTPGGGSEAHGYRLSVQRILELVKEGAAKDADPVKKESSFPEPKRTIFHSVPNR